MSKVFCTKIISCTKYVHILFKVDRASRSHEQGLRCHNETSSSHSRRGYLRLPARPALFASATFFDFLQIIDPQLKMALHSNKKNKKYFFLSTLHRRIFSSRHHQPRFLFVFFNHLTTQKNITI